MTVTVTNLIQGPGTLYAGTYSATAANEPANTAINVAPAASAWTDLGGTQDGVNLELAREFSDLAVDQLVDVPGTRLTKRQFTLATNLAEATLENFSRASNQDPATAVTSGSGYKEYSPEDTPVGEPLYVALIFDGFAPGGLRRRIFGRRMLSTDPVQFAYKKDGQTVFTVKFSGFYVSSSVRSYKIVDQTT